MANLGLLLVRTAMYLDRADNSAPTWILVSDLGFAAAITRTGRFVPSGLRWVVEHTHA